MRKTIFTISMLRACMSLLVALICSTQGAKAADFITDVMVIGHNDKTSFSSLKSKYEKEGWTAINKDLNAGCGTGSDYINLLYKRQSSPGSSGTPITGFYIKTGKNPPSSLTHEVTYHIVSYKGSDDFVKGYGDLNNNAEGDYIYLYYTKDPSPDYNAVTGISFNGTQGGAIGANGGTTGYSLNSGTKGDVIYMHVTVSRTPVELTSSTREVTLQDGDVVFGTGGENTRVNIADGATVTLSSVDITAIPDDNSHWWPSINCEGDAVIILADGTMNKVMGGGYSSGILVPKDHTLTIRGNGSLDATGRYGSAGIGSGQQSSCGNITISGGNITAKGYTHAAGIGSGYKGSCGDITINGGTITANGGSGGAGIGSGFNYSSCGNINISGGTITATGDVNGAGIGSGRDSSCGDITIRGGTITATGGGNCAGIGSGYSSSCVKITISGGNITATSGERGAGIGSGRDSSCGDITISGGTITANGSIGGAGIGNGYDGSCSKITISDGNITATGGTSAAGIGSGRNSSCGDITISGGTITATGGERGSGIGNGYCGSCDNITISGGTITATGGLNSAGIGSGYEGSCGDITIGDGITRISATMGEGAWLGIGQGVGGSCGTVTIAQSLIDLNTGQTRTLWPGQADLVLYNNADNTTIISTYADSKKYDIQLRGRKLHRDGTWNTLCLPFDLDDFSGTPLEGFTVMELDTETAHDSHKTGYDPKDLAYHINFKPATGIKAGKPYIVNLSPDLVIGSTADWDAFATSVKNGTTYEGKVVYLDADITVSTMVGTSDHRFKGIFDGQGHLLTLDNLPSTGQYCAPFRYVDGAIFKNLHTAGNLTSADKYLSGLIGECRGKVTIRNCWSSVAINSSVNGDGTHGGFIGEVKSGGNVTIDNCLFDGSFTGSKTNCWGGFVGWSQGTTTITNSAFLPEDINSLDNSGSKTFGRNNVTTENCYYSVALGDVQGTAVGNMNEEQLAAALGIGWDMAGDRVVPFMIVGSGSVANPVFYGVTVKNVTPMTAASTDGTVSFTGSFKPVTLNSHEYTKLFLGESNKLHYPSAKMDIGSFRASFQLAISKMGDVDNDGGVSLNDILAIVNHILGISNDNDTFLLERADLDKDKEISLADLLLVVDIILNEDQDIKVNVYTGSTPITYDGKGNGEIR